MIAISSTRGPDRVPGFPERTEEYYETHLQVGMLVANAGLFLTLSCPAGAQSNAKKSDAQFASETAAANIVNIELGKLAEKKDYFYRVRDFGKSMVDDRTKLNDQLKAIAAKDNIKIPSTLDAKGKDVPAKLSQLSAVAFDQEYLRAMVLDHQKTVADFQNETLYGMNKDLTQHRPR